MTMVTAVGSDGMVRTDYFSRPFCNLPASGLVAGMGCDDLAVLAPQALQAGDADILAVAVFQPVEQGLHLAQFAA